MSELMVQSHRAARKLAYENKKVWGRCKDRVSLMLENLEKDLGVGSEEYVGDSDLNLSDD